MSKIIGLIGFKHVGKSTAAKYLQEQHGFVRHNMKDGLVSEMKERLPDVLQEFSNFYNMSIDELFTTKPPAMRALMVNYGTDVRRVDKDSYWVDIWKEKATMHKYLGCDFVVDDVRFINEAKAVTDLGGHLIRLVRSDITTGGDHRSETEQLEITPHFTIYGEPDNEQEVYNSLDDILKRML